MPNKNHLRVLPSLIVIFCLPGCAFFSSGTSSKRSSYSKKSIPKVPVKQIPGGVSDNWRYLGTTEDGLVAVEINESSISSKLVNNQKNTTNMVFQDRKTIVDPTKFNYNNINPKYKYSLSWWLMDCDQKRYNITSTSTYDAYGNLLKTYNFNNQLQWNNIDSGSISELQYKYVCQGINRNIGY